jgi:hypothetical protein
VCFEGRRSERCGRVCKNGEGVRGRSGGEASATAVNVTEGEQCLRSGWAIEAEVHVIYGR